MPPTGPPASPPRPAAKRARLTRGRNTRAQRQASPIRARFQTDTAVARAAARCYQRTCATRTCPSLTAPFRAGRVRLPYLSVGGSVLRIRKRLRAAPPPRPPVTAGRAASRLFRASTGASPAALRRARLAELTCARSSNLGAGDLERGVL